EFGGVGFVEIRLRNITLLTKWIMKLERGDTHLSCVLLRNKYLGDKGLHTVKDWFSVGSSYQVQNGKTTRFWHDIWLGQPLKVMFHRLFICSEQQHDTVAEVLQDGLNLSFRRSFGPGEESEWHNLRSSLQELQLTTLPDTGRWERTSRKVFSTKSMYDMMCHSGVPDLEIMDLWNNHSSETKIFT
ncbi:hypothetical protein BRADI_3g40384v3, partial [Brachypodium distachyon]